MEEQIFIDGGTAFRIFGWACAKLDSMTDEQYGGDWWGVYDDEFDVNIWESDGKAIVSVYRTTKNADGDTEVDFGMSCRVGEIDRTLVDRSPDYGRY